VVGHEESHKKDLKKTNKRKGCYKKGGEKIQEKRSSVYVYVETNIYARKKIQPDRKSNKGADEKAKED
jgi:hypothetical protein